MISLDDYLTQAARLARAKLSGRWAKLCQRYGVPREDSALNSFHFLMTEYQEPKPCSPPIPYKVKRGPNPVQTQKAKLPCDTKLGEVLLTYTHPLGTGRTLPTVVLSPGLGAHSSATRYIEEHLASHGYLVLRPTHRGSDFLAAATKTPLGAFTRVELGRRVKEMESSLAALFDGQLGFLPKGERVSLMGHSFGALTACVMAGLPTQDVAPTQLYPVEALVALSPYGDSFPTRRLGISLEGFKSLEHPVLFVSGSRDNLFTLGKGPGTHLEPFHVCQSGEKIHLVIGGTRHGNFSQLCGWVKSATKTMVNSSVVAFLDTHLLGLEESRSYLDSELSMVAFEHGSWTF